MAEQITFDINSLTMGELTKAELASGIDSSDLLTKPAYTRLLAVFVQRLRNSGSVPSWSELEGLRVLDAQSWISGSSADSPGPKSND
jgi:hypothetical protein